MSTLATQLRTVVQMPSQRASSATKNGKQWKEDTVEAIIGLSFFGRNYFHGHRYVVQKLYDYYSGRLDMNDYSHVIRPYGKKRANMPARLQNYNIIKPVIDLLLGEKSQRPFNYVVTTSNPDVITKREEERKTMLGQNLTDNFINELRRMGISTDEEASQVPTPEDTENAFLRDYTDTRADMGQQALQYLEYHQDLPRKFRKGFFHFLVSGMVVTEKRLVGEEVRYSVLNPLEIDYDKSPDTEFIEDGEWVAYRKLCHLSDVIDEFYDELTPKEIKDLEAQRNQDTYDFLFTTDLDNGYIDQRQENDRYNNRLIDVIKVYWKAMKKIGFLTHVDEFGESFIEEVDDFYKPLDGELVEWFWVNEVWEGTRIGSSTKMYKRIQAFESQRNSLDNPSICKLPINGRKYSEINTPSISLTMLGMPFQQLYNIYHYRLEIAVAKAKEAIMHIDKNMIPKGWDMDQFLYYIDAQSIAWSQRKEGDPELSPTHQSVIDLSAKHLDQYIKLLEMIEIQWERLSGVSRQRKGNIGQYEGKGTTEQAIMQSSTITEDLYAKYAEFEEKELEGLIDISKLAWVNGRKGQYVMPDSTIGYIELEGTQHMETEYGIHVVGAGQEGEKIGIMKALAQQVAQQQGTPLRVVADIVDASSFAQLKDQLREIDDTAEQIRQQQMEMEQKAQQAETQAQQATQQFESQENALDRENRLQVATIQAESKGEGGDSLFTVDADESGVPDWIEAIDQVEETELKIDWEREKQQKDLAFKGKQLTQKDKIDEKNIVIKNKQANKPKTSQ